jgi:serine/threonine-protein kinase HipA
MTLERDVRLDGFVEPIGKLTRDERQSMSFVYAATHLGLSAPLPLSLSLPLTDKPYADVQIRSFFQNLLRERDGELQPLMARVGLARDEVAGLLFHLGADCAGAISVPPVGAPPAKVTGNLETDYDPLDEIKLAEIVTSQHRYRRLPTGLRDPWPLAGVESKIALTLMADGSFAAPRAGTGAPTTHILKVPRTDRAGDARLEVESLRLSAACGIETASADLRTIAGIDVAVVERFDRYRNDEALICRRHQEDFAQALVARVGAHGTAGHEAFCRQRRGEPSHVAARYRRRCPAGSRTARCLHRARRRVSLS